MQKKEGKFKPRVSFLFPARILRPVANFLRMELKKVRGQKRVLEENGESDSSGNMAAVDVAVDAQVGRLDFEAKKKFLVARLVQLRKALTRIKLGKYGICEKCGAMIDTDRLTVYPEATVCVACEKEYES